MNNIVYIETSKRTGSGVLLKCECEVNNNIIIGEDEESFIILTNYHVLQDIKDECKDQKNYIDLEIMNVEGNIIDDKFITHIYFASGNNYNNASDAAALLIIVKKMCNVAYFNDVYFGYEDNVLVSSEGYPFVFQDDIINRQLRIEGKVEKYNRQGIGIYKILDDYHWYQDVSDQNLFEGLSGAPVYTKQNNRNYLIGINQSLCNIGEGKNPFKIVYFLNIKNVLEWLRSQNIILFEYYKRNVKIVWLNQGNNSKEKNYNIECDNKEKHIVLLGSSGAGKSSLLKAMCLNGNKIDSSGDGQTTRSTVTYRLEKCCRKPSVSIYFENKTEFVEHRMEQIQFALIEYICCNRFGMKNKDIVADNMVYLRDFLLPMEFLKTWYNSKSINKAVKKIKQTLYLCENNDDVDDNGDKIIECYRKVFESLEKQLRAQSRNDGKREKLLNQFKYLFHKDHYEKYIKKESRLAPEAYYEYILSDKISLEGLEESNNLEKEFKQIVNRCYGYFDIKEFFFLSDNNDMEKECEKIFNEIFFENDVFITQWSSLEEFNSNEEENNLSVEEDEKRQRNPKLYGRIRDYYREIYDCIKKHLQSINVDLSKVYTIMLDGITKKEMIFLAKCMRKKDGDSITGIIKSILVEDSFSNDYALMLHEKGVDRIFFYDTYGTDHVDIGNQNEVYFYNIFNEITDKTRKNIDAIFYVKKLDSGKPAELQKMIPILTRIQPASPIYCIFTGADRFMAGKGDYIEQLRWTKDNYEKNKEFRELLFPKAVSSLYENTSIVSQLKRVPDAIKEKIYRFIINNIVPFSSLYKINDDNIIDLNRKSLDMLFESLLIDEWNIGFINIQEKQREDLKIDNRLLKAIKDDIKNMFKYASESNWENKHHMTVAANFRRIYRYDEKYDKNNPTLGFNRTQINRWDNRLQKGFNESFLAEGNTYHLIMEYGITEQKAYSLLSRLKDIILLKGMSMWEAGTKQGEKKTEFRRIFEKMYELSDFYLMNIFKRQEKLDIKYKTIGEKIEFLNNICNFERGLGNEEILNSFSEYLSKEINNMLKQENFRCYNLLLKHNKAFGNSVATFMEVIGKYSYGTDDIVDMDCKSNKYILDMIFNTAGTE